MHIRSYEIADRLYDPLSLGEDFPVFGGEKISIGSSQNFLHRHNVFEVGYCYEGCGVFIVDDRVYPFSSGDVSIIDSGMFHIAQSSANHSSIWAFIYLDPYRFSASLAPGSYLHNVAELHNVTHFPLLHRAEHPEISSIVWEILDEIQKHAPFYEISVGGLIASLSVKLFRTGKIVNSSGSSSNNAMERMAPALQHIAMHYAEQIPMSILSELCCLSDAQFRRLFHLALGQSPQSYLVRFRMVMSASLLSSTTLHILDIANRVGYSSISSYNRHFKNQFHLSPREWRNLRRLSKHS
ncbi:MAG: AraC family transcriptional regulator [Armatimonadota bacterium]|nr:AraC family transcriptional regulator [bacterium]